MLPMRDRTTTSEDSATQLLICEMPSLAKIVPKIVICGKQIVKFENKCQNWRKKFKFAKIFANCQNCQIECRSS